MSNPGWICMADCEKLVICPFFKEELAYLPQTAALMKGKYCHGDNQQCARYLVSIKGIPIPMDLFPNHADRVPEIIARWENHDRREDRPADGAGGEPYQNVSTLAAESIDH
jgi:hypothetical protein